MKSATVDALVGSIRKWQRIVSGVEADRGANNCPLCKMFYSKWPARCVGCPVYSHTRQEECRGTPFWDFISTCTDYDNRWADTPALRAAAAEELHFLVGLLPKRFRKRV